jgi:hypothetical protein
MTSKREQILAAVFTVLKATEPAALRNAALAIVESGEVVTLRDGEIELTEEFFNGESGSIYEFTATPKVIILIALADDPPDGVPADLDGQLDVRCTAIAAALNTSFAAGALALLATGLRVQPADTEPREIFGAEHLKGAEVPIEIDYWSDKSSG